MLQIQNLTVKTTTNPQKTLLSNINIHLESNKIYALTGANGSGKSTLAKAIMGGLNSNYENFKDDSKSDFKDNFKDDLENPENLDSEISIKSGKILFNNQDIIHTDPDQRAKMGIFTSYQHPVEIPFVPCINFLKETKNQIQKANNLPELTSSEVLTAVKQLVEVLNLPSDYIKRGLNEGLSGGEKKRSEILQMLFFDPSLIILDEIDSGLDSQGLEIIARLINDFLTPAKTLLIISHQQKILDYLRPFQTFKMEELGGAESNLKPV